MAQATEADRERALRFWNLFALAGESPAYRLGVPNPANVLMLAQSYAEVREEAEKEGDKEGLFFASRAFRAGMEEAARIAESIYGPWHSELPPEANARGMAKATAQRIRAAMKEGKP